MTQKRKRSRKWIYWLIVLVLLIVAGVVVYLVWDNYFRDKSGGESEQTTTQAEKSVQKTETKTDEVEKKADEEPEDEKKVKQYEGEDPNNLDTLTGVVTYAGVTDGKLMIRVNIDQYVRSGTCTLGLRREGMNIYSESVAIVNAASTATCEGFDVALDGLGGGNTTIVIYLSGDGKVGEITGGVEL